MKKTIFSSLAFKDEKQLRILCSLVPFIALNGLLFYFFFSKKIEPASGYYLFHFLYNYSHGYMVRGLVGQVLSWFFDKITQSLTLWVLMFFNELLIVASSLCIGKALHACRNNTESFERVLSLILLLAILPGSFRGFFVDIKLEKLFWAITLFAVLLTDSKIGIWFTPVLCILATMVNIVYLFSAMILIAIILFQKFFESGYKKSNLIICTTAYVSMIALALFGVNSQHNLGFENVEEFATFYLSRYDGFHGSLEELNMNETILSQWFSDFFVPYDGWLSYALSQYFVTWGGGLRTILTIVFIVFPAFAIMNALWARAFSYTDDKIQKLVFLFCILSPGVCIPAILVTWDTLRLFSNIIIVNLCLIIYFISHENSAVLKAVSDFSASCRKHAVLSIMLAAYYALPIAF